MEHQMALLENPLSLDEREMLARIEVFRHIDFGDLLYQLRWSQAKVSALVNSLIDRQLVVYVSSVAGCGYSIKKSFDSWHIRMCGVVDPSVFYLNT